MAHAVSADGLVRFLLKTRSRGGALRVEGDGDEKLDFTYIDDLVQGVALAIQMPTARNQIFNLTFGQSRSISDLVDIMKQHFPQVKVQYIERDNLMPFRGTLSVQKARDLLGYQPSNPIDVGFPKYIEWYRENVPEKVPA